MEQSKDPDFLEVGKGIHNKGVFTKKFIAKGTQIVQYKGELITKKESEKRIDEIDKKAEQTKIPGDYYIFDLNKKYDIDGSKEGNIAKFINHSCDPNCETEIVDDAEIWVNSIKDIHPGEELTFDYGFAFDEENFYTHPCKCNSENCVGYIISQDDWKKLEKHLNR